MTIYPSKERKRLSSIPSNTFNVGTVDAGIWSIFRVEIVHMKAARQQTKKINKNKQKKHLL